MKKIIKTLFEKKGYKLVNVGKDNFFTYCIRPKRVKDFKKSTDIIEDKYKIGIVIQGPIKYEDDFTLETVKLYMQNYPNAEIIVSTWSNENEEMLEKIRALGGHVCVSEVMNNITGFGTINLQRETSLKGIRYAYDLGCDFIAKTRTDQRVYALNVWKYLTNLLKCYPIRVDVDAQDRIITTSLCTFSDRLYNLSDIFVFGRAKDILKYFSCPVDMRDHSFKLTETDLVEYSKARTGEIYFSTHYFEALGFELKWTKEDSDFYCKELFIVIDSESIDLYWNKYNEQEYRWREYYSQRLKPVTFRDWVCMQTEE